MTNTQWAGVLLAGILVLAAVEAGEYSTWDWLALRRQLREEERAVAELRVAIDSLARVAKAVENDPETQERIAREQFGMIRQGEFLYKLVPPEGMPKKEE